jgi:hypothetical protein
MSHRILEEAQERLKQSIMTYKQMPVGTVAAKEISPKEEQLNYGHCFVRDFVPSGLAFLMKGEREIVRNFLEFTLGLQSDRLGLKEGEGLFAEVRRSWERKELLIDGIRLGEGLMPASFEVTSSQDIEPDFGQRAIGRVTPVDSGLWWIILLSVSNCQSTGGKYRFSARIPARYSINFGYLFKQAVRHDANHVSARSGIYD